MHDHPLIRKLEGQGLRLTDEEQLALLAMPMQVESLRADQDIVREGDRPTRSCLILEGYAAMYKVTPTGKRQIVAFHLAGDIPDLQSSQLEVLDTSRGGSVRLNSSLSRDKWSPAGFRLPRIAAAG